MEAEGTSSPVPVGFLRRREPEDGAPPADGPVAPPADGPGAPPPSSGGPLATHAPPSAALESEPWSGAAPTTARRPAEALKKARRRQAAGNVVRLALALAVVAACAAGIAYLGMHSKAYKDWRIDREVGSAPRETDVGDPIVQAKFDARVAKWIEHELGGEPRLTAVSVGVRGLADGAPDEVVVRFGADTKATVQRVCEVTRDLVVDHDGWDRWTVTAQATLPAEAGGAHRVAAVPGEDCTAT